MPNQENVINLVRRVTYRDTPERLPEILLPNRELAQVNFSPAQGNSFPQRRKQEWEGDRFQNGTGPHRHAAAACFLKASMARKWLGRNSFPLRRPGRAFLFRPWPRPLHFV